MWAGRPVGMGLMQQAAALVDNEPFVSQPALALTRTPVSLTLQFPSQESRHWLSGTNNPVQDSFTEGDVGLLGPPAGG